MANLASSKKRVRSTKRRAAENLFWRKKIRNLAKKVRSGEGSELKKDDTAALIRSAQETLSKAAKKKVIHKNKAARLTSRWSKKLQRS